MFQGSGAVFTTLGALRDAACRQDFTIPLTRTRAGFEYFANPDNRDEGFITWQVNGAPTVTMGASAVGPDMGTNGSQISQRIVPEEPMVSGSPEAAHARADAFFSSLRLRPCAVDHNEFGHVEYVFSLLASRE